MSDGGLHSFWNSLQRAEQRIEAEAKATERDLYRTVYGYKSRVMRLRSALAKSGPIAFQTVSRKLEGIDLKVIWPILFSAVRDMALYYGGSVVLGTAVGAGLGSLAFGFGAIPGAAIGAEAGSVVGDWVLIYLGLQMLAEGLVNTIPPALRLYVQGFRLAWGPVDSDRPDARYSADYHQGEDMAAHRFADGHVLMIIAILMAMVAYLTRGKSEEALMQAVRKSERLGTKMADWLADNKEKLLKEESLKPKLLPRAEPAKEEAPQAIKRPRPSLKSTAPNSPAPREVVPQPKALKDVLNEKWGESNVASALAAKQANPELDGLLTDDEYLAIRGYTSNLYRQINPALRSGAPGDWQILADNASSGMDKLAANGYGYQGTVIRNATFTDDQVGSMFQPGGTFTDQGFMSTTTNMDGVFSGNVTFHVQSETGVSVADLSDYPESEVLFKPNTTFNVLDASKNPATGTWDVFMSEAAPQ